MPPPRPAPGRGGLVAPTQGASAAVGVAATLAIITNVFTDPIDRAKAIGVWGATTGIAVAVGPVFGGWLLEHFWWGSIFFVNVPIAVVALAGTLAFVPESKDSTIHHVDPLGLLPGNRGRR